MEPILPSLMVLQKKTKIGSLSLSYWYQSPIPYERSNWLTGTPFEFYIEYFMKSARVRCALAVNVSEIEQVSIVNECDSW